MPPKPKLYKVYRETSKPTTLWHSNAERHSYTELIGSYSNFKEAKEEAKTNLSNEWDEKLFSVDSIDDKKDYYEMKASFDEGEEMRVYTVKEDEEITPETKTAKTTNTKNASSSKKAAAGKPKTKPTAKKPSESKKAIIGNKPSTSGRTTQSRKVVKQPAQSTSAKTPTKRISKQGQTAK